MGNTGRKADTKDIEVSFPTINFGLSSISHTSYLLSRGGRIFSWGCGDFGQLGKGKVKLRADDYEPPEVIPLPHIQFVAIAGGQNHALSLSSEGHVYAWGQASLGALGLGTEGPAKRPTPEKISGLEDIVGISCGQSHSLALRKDGRVFSWGRGDLGALGHHEKKTEFSPRLISALEKHQIIAINCGNDFSLALTSEHTVFGWGLRQAIPLLVPELDNAMSLACSGTGRNFVLKRDGSVWSWSAGGTPKKLHFESASNIIAIAAGGQELLVLSNDGELNCFNFADKKEETQRHIASKVIHMACFAYHSMFITDENKLYSYGVDTYGRLGRPEVQGDPSNRDIKEVELPKGYRWHFNSHTNLATENWFFFLTKWTKIRFLCLGQQDEACFFSNLPKDLVFTIAGYL